jgi:hypothetical protein
MTLAAAETALYLEVEAHSAVAGSGTPAPEDLPMVLAAEKP